MCGSNVHNLLLAGLWLRLEGCQLVGLPATSIKQHWQAREIRTSLYLIFDQVNMTPDHMTPVY